MRSIFATQPFAYDAALAGRPLIVVHNKYNVEWSERPINFIPLPVLDALFAAHKSDFNMSISGTAWKRRPRASPGP